MSEAVLHELIDRIYAAALDAERWPSVLAAVAGAVDGTAAALVTAAGHHPGVLATAGYSVDDIATYGSHFAAADDRQRHLGEAPPGMVLADDHHIAFDPYRRTPTHGDFFAPRGLGHGMGVALLAQEERRAAISVMRAAGRGAFDAGAVDLLQRLTPHLSRALQVHGRLSQGAAAERGLDTAIGHIRVAALMIDRVGRIVRLNPAADRLLSRPGCPLGVSRGRVAASGRQARVLDRFLAELAGATPPPITRLPALDGTALSLLAVPTGAGHHLLLVADTAAEFKLLNRTLRAEAA